MKDSNCIFCKIANGEIPSATLYCLRFRKMFSGKQQV